jgi:hypothetical protein
MNTHHNNVGVPIDRCAPQHFIFSPRNSPCDHTHHKGAPGLADGRSESRKRKQQRHGAQSSKGKHDHNHSGKMSLVGLKLYISNLSTQVSGRPSCVCPVRNGGGSGGDLEILAKQHAMSTMHHPMMPVSAAILAAPSHPHQ